MAAALATVVYLDSRYEFTAIMDAHDMHAVRVADRSALTLATKETTPNAVVRHTLVLHAEAGFVTLLVLAIAVDLTLSRLVLTPLARISAGIERLRSGQRIGVLRGGASDEVAGLVEAFGQLGLTLDAVMLHAMQTDRLATLALLSKHITTEIEPEVRELGVTATRLLQVSDGTAQEAAHAVAASAARILTATHRLDRPFDHTLERR